MPVEKILTQIKDDHYLKWPRPLHSSSNVPIKTSIADFTKIMAITWKIVGI